MAGSNIPDIASDPEKGILKVSAFSFVIHVYTSLCFYMTGICVGAPSIASREVSVGLGR